MTKYKLKSTKVEKKVVGAYKKIENGVVESFGAMCEGVVDGYKNIENSVVDTYKAIENGVVGGYKKIEKKFVDTFLEEK